MADLSPRPLNARLTFHTLSLSLSLCVQWYGAAHKAPELQKDVVYGLTEFKRAEVASASLVANPGCYPTSIQLPLIPLLEHKLITSEDVIIDAKSGVSGAGRGAKQSNLYVEIAEGMNSYGITSHRHVPEVEQQLREVASGTHALRALDSAPSPSSLPLPLSLSLSP